MMVRVRIAPSPTGIPHIGNTRTALFNYLFAKHHKGKFLLRIEDTDQKRTVAGAKEAIVEILKWLEIEPDEKPYTQSEHLDIYKNHIKILLGRGVAYEKDGAVWIRVLKDEPFSWEDAVGNKRITFRQDTVKDFVAIKSDGFPTYHFASVVDDHKMCISHVIRGDEWISSTPKHIFLYESFGWEKPVFAHLPVILGPDRTKLSKRHGAKSAIDYRDEGYLREALINFMALLGWNPGENREIMDLESMTRLFDLKDINTGSAIFDIKKLSWMNGVYIREKLSDKDFKEKLSYFYKDDKKVLEFLNNDSILRSAKTRIETFANFKNIVEDNRKVSLNEKQKMLAQKLQETYQNLSPWNATTISTATIAVRNQLGNTTKDIYTVLTGKPGGIPFEIKTEAKGQAGTISWLEHMLKK